MIYVIIIKRAKMFCIWLYQFVKEQENFILLNPWIKNPQKNVVAQHHKEGPLTADKSFFICSKHFGKPVLKEI